MRALHVVYSFPPDPPGGTEIYVGALCRSLRARGVESVIAAPDARDATYDVEGLRVRRFGVGTGPLTLDALYGAGDADAARAFSQVLDDEMPDVVHQHALTPACSIEIARATKARGIPLVFTYHTPTVSCVRGTLLKWGREVCDGRVTADVCARCVLDGHGVRAAWSRPIAAWPSASERLAALSPSTRARTALRLPALMRAYESQLHAFFDLVDAFVVLSPWVGALLRANGIGSERLMSSPHGVELPASPPRRSDAARHDGPVRFVHFGRIDPTKGTTLLVDAVRHIPHANLRLDIFGVVQNDDARLRAAAVQRLAAGDNRIRLLPAIEHARMMDALGGYDAVLVPSQWMETGPLVVLEAFAAGLPVIGSDLGSIRDKIRDGLDGLLVRPFDSAGAWAETLETCAADPVRVSRLGDRVRPPRSVDDVAADMCALYGRLVRPSLVETRDRTAAASV